MNKHLTDNLPMSREVALQLSQCEMGDYIELEDGRMMCIDGWECYTKNFLGRVMMQPTETRMVVPISKVIVRVTSMGKPYRVLRVKSKALPILEREPVDPAELGEEV